MLSLFLLMPVSVAAAEIYKWMDENGKVHYGDHPPPGQHAEQVEVKQALQQDPGYRERMDRQSRLLGIYDEERREKATMRTRLEEEEKERRTNCTRARQELQGIKKARYLSEDTGDPANPRILNTEERTQATTKAQSRVRKWC